MITTQSNSEASQIYDEKNIDLFSRPPAGYSLTQTPEKWPWDKPPQYVKLQDAYENIKNRMLKPSALYDTLNLLDAGISVETIVRSITFAAFTKGLINPDVAELLLPPLGLLLTLEARKAGISATVRSNITPTTIPENEILDIMKDLRPEKYYTMKAKVKYKKENSPVEETEIGMEKQIVDSFLTPVNREGK
jgi:hypothetical protein|tara:strand:- start:93 stop:668 length:576 start_codon:yes stop_codon:yes gene_type:complete